MSPELRPYVEAIWLSDACAPGGIEHVLPTGDMHLVFRLAGPPVTLAAEGRLGWAVVGGARSRYYAKHASYSRAVGAVLKPGAAAAILSASAPELVARHTRLSDLWGGAADRTLERLAEAEDPVAALEEILLERARRGPAADPAAARAAMRLASGADVDAVVRESGYSHRRFIARFRDAAGLPPKLYSRVKRFGRALAQREAPWADVAAGCGYADQSHFHRDFVEFAGVTPNQYRRIRPEHSNHVPIGQKSSRPATGLCSTLTS